MAGSERISRRSGGPRGVSRGSRGGEGRGARGMRGTQQRAQHACTSESRWPPSPSPPPPCRCVLARVIDGRRRPVARASSRMLRRVGTDAWNQQPTVHRARASTRPVPPPPTQAVRAPRVSAPRRAQRRRRRVRARDRSRARPAAATRSQHITPTRVSPLDDSSPRSSPLAADPPPEPEPRSNQPPFAPRPPSLR